MKAPPSSQQDSTGSATADAAMQELKGALQSAIVPLAGVWVAAGKALISGASEGLLSTRPLETWGDLKNAAQEAIEPLVGVMADEHEAGEGRRPLKPATDDPGTARGAQRTKARSAGSTTAAKRAGAPAKKRSGGARSRGRAPRAKAS